MKHFRIARACRALCLFSLLWTAALPAAAADGAPPQTLSAAYAVADADSGQLLFGKNADERMYPASVTKVLTVALALEGHAPEESFVLGDEVLEIDPGSTYVALTPGEKVTVEQMAYAAMLPSANDAANALAVYDAGSIESFVEKMNAKARELGADNTRFVNPSGLHDPGHYTTARDFALITRWAMTVPGFMTYFGADEYTMPPTNKQPEARAWGTNNCLTVESAYIYDGATGGKLGYTQEALHTLAASAGRDGLNVVVVEFKSSVKWDKFKDAVALLDYTFANFERRSYAVPEVGHDVRVPLYEGETQVGNVRMTLPASVPYVAKKGDDEGNLQARLDAPARYEKGEAIAPQLALYSGDALVCAVPLPYTVDEKEQAVDAAGEEAPAEAWGFPLELIVRILLWAIGLVVAVFIVLLILRDINRRKRRRRRIERYRRMDRGNYQRRH